MGPTWSMDLICRLAGIQGRVQEGVPLMEWDFITVTKTHWKNECTSWCLFPCLGGPSVLGQSRPGRRKKKYLFHCLCGWWKINGVFFVSAFCLTLAGLSGNSCTDLCVSLVISYSTYHLHDAELRRLHSSLHHKLYMPHAGESACAFLLAVLASVSTYYYE